MKISDVHSNVATALTTMVGMLESAIEFREKEIANMKLCIVACKKVIADEVLPSDVKTANVQKILATQLDTALVNRVKETERMINELPNPNNDWIPNR